jgi:transcriptional regulator of acetoin/glycerol metabolism
VEQTVEQAEPVMFTGVSKSSTFPTMAEMERAMIVSAYNRSNRKSVEAAKLLGMGKTTFYPKLKEVGKRAAWSSNPH